MACDSFATIAMALTSGEQTVPRAELLALVLATQAAAAAGIATATFVSDCQYVVRLDQPLREGRLDRPPLTAQNRDLLVLAQAAWRPDFRVIKVRAHQNVNAMHMMHGRPWVMSMLIALPRVSSTARCLS